MKQKSKFRVNSIEYGKIFWAIIKPDIFYALKSGCPLKPLPPQCQKVFACVFFAEGITVSHFQSFSTFIKWNKKVKRQLGYLKTELNTIANIEHSLPLVYQSVLHNEMGYSRNRKYVMLRFQIFLAKGLINILEEKNHGCKLFCSIINYRVSITDI